MLSQLHQAASIVTLKQGGSCPLSVFRKLPPHLLIPYRAKDVIVGARVAHKLPFKEPNVDDGGVEVYKLENENFEGQIIVICRLCSVHF